ncbi:hypothetical protein [Lactococcus garvieae]|uniref:Uncharacterized protein n=1 Tax=Lactococcus garvieae DCC43 TaxID=1231377 RepID=K2QAE2_9LACT|nr:hypothetical protein [Lactococcus garvieae]EKF50487.1 hypothetical protein C426_2157 [Lactococcus garvieae DCC43]QPS71954.1 hypothetical protein I6G50_04625 [Lactococcus garvieae]
MNDIKILFSKLGIASSPLKLIKLVKQADHLLKKHQNNYPNDKKSDDLYLKVDETLYILQKKKFAKTENLPQKANFMIVTEDAIANSLAILGEARDKDINCLLKALKRNKKIETCQKIMDEIAEDFSTNLTINHFIKIVGSKLF